MWWRADVKNWQCLLWLCLLCGSVQPLVTTLSDVPVAETNLFLHHVTKQIKTRSDLVCQHYLQTNLHVPKSMTHWLRLKTWADFVTKVNSYELKPDEQSVLVHIVGGVGVGRLFAQMRESLPQGKVTTNHPKKKRKQGKVRARGRETRQLSGQPMMRYNVTIGSRQVRMFIEKSNYVSESIIDRAMTQLNKRVTFLHIEGANWGILSEVIRDRTMQDTRRSLTYRLISEGADMNSLRHFLDHDKVVAYVVNGAVSDELGVHPKVVPVPLGVSPNHSFALMNSLDQLNFQPVRKNKLMVVNVNPTVTRAPLIENLRNKIHPSLLDIAYDVHTPHSTLYATVSQAKFVFCPSGLGLDTYRMWEALLLGAIPVVESNPGGLDRTYASLPVLVVKDFRDITEELLMKAYVCFKENVGRFRFEHLTQGYWIDVVRRVQQTGSPEVYNSEHPVVNPHCHFMK
mmetsp:Transcript_31547/g.58724  ORF Transcript_31547/g.58724 Transcript_31547/m.58724 type:complete len:456 (-) Transcript_31547:111-1478(-)